MILSIFGNECSRDHFTSDRKDPQLYTERAAKTLKNSIGYVMALPT